MIHQPWPTTRNHDYQPSLTNGQCRSVTIVKSRGYGSIEQMCKGGTGPRTALLPAVPHQDAPPEAFWGAHPVAIDFAYSLGHSKQNGSSAGFPRGQRKPSPWLSPRNTTFLSWNMLKHWLLPIWNTTFLSFWTWEPATSASGEFACDGEFTREGGRDSPSWQV